MKVIDNYLNYKLRFRGKCFQIANVNNYMLISLFLCLVSLVRTRSEGAAATGTVGGHKRQGIW